MTARQIEKKLQQAGINTGYIEISRDEVEIYVTDEDGDYDYDATRELMDKVSEVLVWGGYSCAYGGWVLRNGYRLSEADLLDYCNPASSMHY